MIRANLLPRPSERVRLFGFSIARDIVRSAALAIAALLFTAACGRTIEWIRATTLESQADFDEMQLSRNAAERARLRALSARVADLHAIDLVATATLHSGDDAARTIVRIGNAVPPRVWLDELVRTDGQFQLTGRSATLAQLGLAVASMQRQLPDREPVILGVDGTEDRAIRFSARLRDRDAK